MLSHVKFIDCTYDIYSDGHYLRTHLRLEGFKKLGGQRFLPIIVHLLPLFLPDNINYQKVVKMMTDIVYITCLNTFIQKAQGTVITAPPNFLKEKACISRQTLYRSCFPDSWVCKGSACNSGDPSSVPGFLLEKEQATHSNILGLPLWPSW